MDTSPGHAEAWFDISRVALKMLSRVYGDRIAAIPETFGLIMIGLIGAVYAACNRRSVSRWQFDILHGLSRGPFVRIRFGWFQLIDGFFWCWSCPAQPHYPCLLSPVRHK